MCKISPCLNGGEAYDGMCLFHWKIYGTKKVKEKTPIPKVSAKRTKELAEYNKKAKQFKKEHPVCELNLKGCTLKTEDIHHIKGRENALLNDELFWKAACRSCHRKVTEHSKQAIEQGHSKSRHKKQ